DGPAYAPSGDAVGFGHAVDGDGAVGHSFEAGDGNVARTIVEDVLVDFVGDSEDIEFEAEVADDSEFGASEHFAGGIVGSVQDDGLGMAVESAAKFAFVEGPFVGGRSGRPKFHETGLRATQDRIGPVVFVVRFEDHNLIAGIANGEQGGNHRFGGTTTD